MTVELFEPAPIYLIQNAGPYAVPHPYDSDAIVVRVIDGTQIVNLIPTQYSVTPASSGAQGTVTIDASALSDLLGKQLLIERATPDEQGWQGIMGEREFGLERQLDRIVMSLQELRRGLSTSLRSVFPIAAIVPEEGRTLVYQDGALVAGPTADEISQASAHAADAQAARDETLAASARMYDTLEDLRADPVGYAAGVLLSVRGSGAAYEVLASGQPAELTRTDGTGLRVALAPAESGPGVLGAGAGAAQLLAAPAFLRDRAGSVRVEDLGIRTGAAHADANVVRMNEAIAAINGGAFRDLRFGAGRFFFSNTLDRVVASNLVIRGLARGATHVTLDGTTNSHKGRLFLIGGFASIYNFTAAAGQLTFSGGGMAFSGGSEISVQLNGVEVDFTTSVASQSITLDEPASVDDIIRVQVSSATAANIRVEGFRFDCLAPLSDLTRQLIHLGAVGNLTLADMRPDASLAGFLRGGSEGNIGSVMLSDVQGGFAPECAISPIAISGAGWLRMESVALFGPRNRGEHLSSLVNLSPGYGQVIDTVIMDSCRFYAFEGTNYNINIDATNGAVTNLWMARTTLDRGIQGNIRVVDGGASASRWLRNFWVSDCYLRLAQGKAGSSANNISFNLTGAKTRLDNFQAKGCVLGFETAAAVSVRMTQPTSQVNGFLLNGVQFAHQNRNAGAVPVPACVDIGAPNVQVKNSSVSPAFHTAIARVNHIARILDETDNFQIVGNDNAACLVGDVSHFAYVSASARRLVKDNTLTRTEYTTAELGSGGHSINTAGKFAGKTVWNSTIGAPVFANGSGRLAAWRRVSDESVVVTPT